LRERQQTRLLPVRHSWNCTIFSYHQSHHSLQLTFSFLIRASLDNSVHRITTTMSLNAVFMQKPPLNQEILALRRLRQQDHEFEASLGCLEKNPKNIHNFPSFFPINSNDNNKTSRTVLCAGTAGWILFLWFCKCQSSLPEPSSLLTKRCSRTPPPSSLSLSRSFFGLCPGFTGL
jgi:hypothetical protein